MKATYTPVTDKNLTRVNSDSNGNPRYVFHFTLIDGCPHDDINKGYDWACREAKNIIPGSRKYHVKSYGGGIVVKSYAPDLEIVRELNRHNMATFIDRVIGINEIVCVAYTDSMFVFTITDKHDNFDSSNIRVYLLFNADEKQIRLALANKSLISFDEVNA